MLWNPVLVRIRAWFSGDITSYTILTLNNEAAVERKLIWQLKWPGRLFHWFQSHLPPRRPYHLWSTGGKRWATSLPPHILLFLPVRPHNIPQTIPPCFSSPVSHHWSCLSSHTSPPFSSHGLLIDEATFDNGIRNRGVCLVIRYYQSCLITAEEDLRHTDKFLWAQIWSADNEALQRCALIYLAELIHPSHVSKFRGLTQITWTSYRQDDTCMSL